MLRAFSESEARPSIERSLGRFCVAMEVDQRRTILARKSVGLGRRVQGGLGRVNARDNRVAEEKL